MRNGAYRDLASPINFYDLCAGTLVGFFIRRPGHYLECSYYLARCSRGTHLCMKVFSSTTGILVMKVLLHMQVL